MTLSTLCRETFWSSRDWVTTMREEMASYQQGVGQRLKALRQNRNLSQEDAAQLVGVSWTTWRNWERGLHNPYESNWRKLRSAFDLSEEQVAAIRGKPPEPLGLGADAQADEILSLLRSTDERLRRIEELLARRELEDVADQLEDEPPATAAG